MSWNDETNDYQLPEQTKDICDQCGNLETDFMLTKCPKCDWDICDSCQHCCNNCKNCGKDKAKNQKYCSLQCKGSWEGKMWHRNNNR